MQAAAGKNLRIAGKSHRIAGHQSKSADRGTGDFAGLGLGPRAGRINHDCVKDGQLIGQQRAPGQVAILDRDAIQPRRGAPSGAARGAARPSTA